MWALKVMLESFSMEYTQQAHLPAGNQGGGRVLKARLWFLFVHWFIITES